MEYGNQVRRVPPPSRALLVAGCALSLLLTPDRGAAQADDGCPEGRIARVQIQTRGVFEGDTADAMLSRVSSAVGWLHVTTRRRVIRRELLFEEGDCHEALRLSETERLLRGFSFLRDARIETRRRPDGDLDVTVTTEDDWSFRIEPRVEFGSGLGLTGLSIGENNLWGTGRSVEAFFHDRSRGNEFGFSARDPQLLGSRWNLDLTASRTEPGGFVQARVSYPFLGLVGRRAAFQDAVSERRWFRYIARDDAERRNELLLPFRRTAVQVGGGLRPGIEVSGNTTKLGTFGIYLSFGDLSYDDAFFGDSLVEASMPFSGDSASARVLAGLEPRRTLRLNVLLGARGIAFIKRRGLSTLDATEDIPIGVATDLVIGLAAPALGTNDSHALIALDSFAGGRVGERWLTQFRGTLEGRRDYESDDWRDVFGAFEWSNFWLWSGGNTLEVSLRAAAARDPTIPFQLTLGGPAGLRGYEGHRYPGGARVVASLEDRSHIWSAGGLFDLGTAVFVDAGAMWSGDAPFGMDSGLRASGGAGIRVATPGGSRSSYRLDLAVPFQAGTRLEDVVLTFRVQRPIRFESGAGDPQLERSRDFALRTASRFLK